MAKNIFKNSQLKRFQTSKCQQCLTSKTSVTNINVDVTLGHPIKLDGITLAEKKLLTRRQFSHRFIVDLKSK